MSELTVAPQPLTPSEWAERQERFRRDLVAVLNRHCKENDSDTPDWILADYIIGCMNAWNNSSRMRDKWWSFRPWVNGPDAAPRSPEEK
jgi:hypothetical protein